MERDNKNSATTARSRWSFTPRSTPTRCLRWTPTHRRRTPGLAYNGPMSEDQRDALIRAWQSAQRELKIRVTAPFSLSTGTATHNCVAFLPDFGSPAGMVIDAIEPPLFRPSKGLATAAEAAGLYLSLISAEVYLHFDSEKFKEALLEWGFFGPDPLRPSWWPDTQPE
jgi:hypothetical protein